MNDEDEPWSLRYELPERIDFDILGSTSRQLPFFSDDLFLGMQVMNVGIVDRLITEREYQLLAEYRELERTPSISATEVSALSQMWIYGLYEVIRTWRDRKWEFEKLHQHGGIPARLETLARQGDMNITAATRKLQLSRFQDDADYRTAIDRAWQTLEPLYRATELVRMNLAKHVAPGKNSRIPRMPGYARINTLCGALDYELVDKSGEYLVLNRRDIADWLRAAVHAARGPTA